MARSGYSCFISPEFRHILDSDKSATTRAMEKFDKRVATIKDKRMQMATQRDKKAMESAFLTTMAGWDTVESCKSSPYNNFYVRRRPMVASKDELAW